MSAHTWPTEAEIINECRAAFCQYWKVEYVPPTGQPAIHTAVSSINNGVYISRSWVAKIRRRTKSRLESELACMKYIQSTVEPGVVQLPIVYPKIIHDTIAGLNVYYLVMEKIQGKTFQQLKEEGKTSQQALLNIIDKLATALDHIRRTVPAPSDDLLLPMNETTKQPNIWSAMAPCFNLYFQTPQDGILYATRQQLNKLILDKASPHFEKTGRMQVLQTYLQSQTTFTHGDLSENNVMITSQKGLVLLDYGTSFWGPSWWELAALPHWESYSKEYVQAFEEAMQRRGVSKDSVGAEILMAIRNWYIEHGGF